MHARKKEVSVFKASNFFENFEKFAFLSNWLRVAKRRRFLGRDLLPNCGFKIVDCMQKGDLVGFSGAMVMFNSFFIWENAKVCIGMCPKIQRLSRRENFHVGTILSFSLNSGVDPHNFIPTRRFDRLD